MEMNEILLGLFGNKYRPKIVKYIFEKQTDGYSGVFLTEIAKMLDLPTTLTFSNLNELERAGILVSKMTPKGNSRPPKAEKLYAINPNLSQEIRVKIRELIKGF